jgi:hypothetical protein
MTTISRNQWDRMGQDSFDARLIGILRRHHPEQAGRMEFPQLVSAIHRQIAQARTYGLNDERSVATYVYTSWLMGEEFDKRIPALAQILRERKMPSSDKATALGNFSKLVFHTLGGGGAPGSARSAA